MAVKIDSHPGIRFGQKIEDAIIRAAENVLTMERKEDCEVSIFITDDVEIRKLNKSYRGVDKTTDVLAFAMREGVDGDLNQEILGDVVISLATAKLQSAIYNYDLEVEMSLLVSHGVLHLLGYEHKEKSDLLIMQQKQKETLRSLGFSPEISEKASRIDNG
jgi:probable rRNA maturation factor